jgi:predicted small metal-binding protein
MPYRLACGRLMPGCPFTAEAATEEELLKKAAAHASEAHGIKEITPELAAKVKDRGNPALTRPRPE